jgi:hypothetical protein
MTKLSNAKKNVKSVQTVEINTVDVAAEQVASTLVKRIALDASDQTVTKIALDASDLRANNHSFAGCEIDYSIESTVVDLVNFARPAVSENGGTFIEMPDPMAPYAHHMVKLSYVFDGMELDLGRIFRGWDASKEAEIRANDKTGPKVPVAIRCATSNELFFTVYPVKGARTVSVVPDNRQTSTRTVTKVGMSEEEKARIEAERVRKEEERAAKAWDAMVDAAEKDNAKFDAQREKQIKEMAAKLAKAQAKLMRHPKIDSDAYNNFLLLRRENGATCKELNHEHNMRSGLSNANFGWKQIALDMEKKFTYRLIAMGRQCQVAEKKGLSEAMRLIDRDMEIPAGWVDISRF